MKSVFSLIRNSFWKRTCSFGILKQLLSSNKSLFLVLVHNAWLRCVLLLDSYLLINYYKINDLQFFYKDNEQHTVYCGR